MSRARIGITQQIGSRFIVQHTVNITIVGIGRVNIDCPQLGAAIKGIRAHLSHCAGNRDISNVVSAVTRPVLHLGDSIGHPIVGDGGRNDQFARAHVIGLSC